jgi:2-dehydropantoate 2-reductase
VTAGITLVGAGALGCGLAAYLGSSGPVTLLTRPSTLAGLAAAGALRVDGPGGTRQLPLAGGSLRVISDAAMIPADDAVFFVTKGPQLPAVAGQVARSWPRGAGWVAGLQNGVAKDDILRRLFGDEVTVGAATVFGARRAGDGTVLVTGLNPTYLGEFGQPPSARVLAVRRRFTDAGLPCDLPEDIRSLLWSKCANAVGAFGVSALTRLASTAMMRREPLVLAYLDLVRETALVAAAAGVEIADYPDLPMATYLSGPATVTATAILSRARGLPVTTPSYSSMAQDVIAGRPTEVEDVFGDVLQRAGDLGVAVPRIEFTYRIIAGLQAPES